MTRTTLLLALALGFAALAGSAAAAPFIAAGNSTDAAIVMDQGSLVRTGSIAEVDALSVNKTGKPLIAHVRFDCQARTWQQMSIRSMGSDGVWTAPTPLDWPVKPVAPQSLGDALLERACFDRQVDSSGDWSAATLPEAIATARARLNR